MRAQQRADLGDGTCRVGSGFISLVVEGSGGGKHVALESGRAARVLRICCSLRDCSSRGESWSGQ